MRKFGFEKVRLSEIARDLGVTHAALYSHFSDKAALFDAISERWLNQLDEQLEVISADTQIDPLERITNWFVHLHKAKRAKVCNDPELFRAFNFSAQMDKPFVQQHMKTMDRQLTDLALEAVNAGLLTGTPPEIASLLFHSTIGFHHPILVAASLSQDLEPLLRQLLKTLFAGLAKAD